MLIFDKNKKIHEQLNKDNWCQGPFYKNLGGQGSLRPTEHTVAACLAGWMYEVYGLNTTNARFNEADRRAEEAAAKKCGHTSYIRLSESAKSVEEVIEFCILADI